MKDVTRDDGKKGITGAEDIWAARGTARSQVAWA